MLVGVPAVLAQDGGDGDRQDPVKVCHFAGGKYEVAVGLETDFYGLHQRDHGKHDEDIVPPFTIENPRSDDPPSFPGRNWDERGQAIYNAGCEEPAPPPEPERKVRICHATSADKNPYVSNEPAIANNGDLHGGHLDHTGPVYPANGWGDIIPPYPTSTRMASRRCSPATTGARRVRRSGRTAASRRIRRIRRARADHADPRVCRGAGGGSFLAHFGYVNPNATTIEPAGEREQLLAAAGGSRAAGRIRLGTGRGRLPGRVRRRRIDVVPDGEQATAYSDSPRCGGSITIVKNLVPPNDPGRFNLKIDGEVAGDGAAVGDQGTTGTIEVSPGSHASASPERGGTSLADYNVRSSAVTKVDEGRRQGRKRPVVAVQVGRGSEVVCTITNTAEQKADDRDVSPVLECVVFNDGSPDVAVWGYENRTNNPITIPVGDATASFRRPAGRGQPTVFEPGRVVGVFTTPFEAETDLVWSLSGRIATASAGSPRLHRDGPGAQGRRAG